MTDHWDFYPLRVESKPASTFVDLGIAESAPLVHLPYVAHVRLYMNDPRPDGLSSREEFDALVRVEEALQQALCNEGVGYVGRCTTNGCRVLEEDGDPLTLALFAAARRHHGDYDGWECQVETEQDGSDAR